MAALVDLVCVWCAKWCYGGGCGAHRAMRKQLPEMHIASCIMHVHLYVRQVLDHLDDDENRIVVTLT